MFEKVTVIGAGRAGSAIAARLQAAGVRAAALQSMEDIVDHDPQRAIAGVVVDLRTPSSFAFLAILVIGVTRGGLGGSGALQHRIAWRDRAATL